jgi:hypothetical protein
MAEDLTWSIGEPYPRLPAEETKGWRSGQGLGQLGNEVTNGRRISGEGGIRRRGLPCGRPSRSKGPASRRSLSAAERAGFEGGQSVGITTNIVDSRQSESTRVDASARQQVAIGPQEIRSPAGALTVEDALAIALVRASAANEWGVVAQLARELEARRLGAVGVRSLPGERGR